MDNELRTRVDSLVIQSGVYQHEPANISVLETSSTVPTRHGRSHVYVVVETVGGFPDPAAVQQEIIGVVQDAAQTPGSITAGIREGIKQANDYLFEKNLQATREERGIAGLTCVVLRDNEAFVGQCGPAVLYHIHHDGIGQLPEDSTWLSSDQLQEVDVGIQPPLGLRRQIEPALSHLSVADGDVLLLTSTTLGRSASKEQIERSTRGLSLQTTRDNLERLAEGQDVTVLAIELTAAKAPPSIAPGRPRSMARAPGGLLEKVRSGILSLLGRSPSSAASSTRTSEEARPAPRAHARPAVRLPHIDLTKAWNVVKDAGARLIQALATLFVRILPDTDVAESQKRTRGAKDTRRKGVQAPSQARQRWLLAAILIPVIVLLIYVSSRLQYDRSRRAEFVQLTAALEETMTAAQASTVPEIQRVKWAEALSLVDQGLEQRPTDTDLQATRDTILSALDEVNRVHRFSHVVLLEKFGAGADATSQPSKVLMDGREVWVLDTGADTVYGLMLNDTRDAFERPAGESVLVRKGDQYDGMTMEELLDMAWVSAGGQRGTSTLMILDRAGHLLQYDPSFELQMLRALDVADWRQPSEATGYFGRLYVLDRQANQMFRYVLTNSGYQGGVSGYFPAETSPNMSTANDVAIDGNVYVLHETGIIAKFSEGVSVPFEPRNLDVPLSSPSAMAITGFMDEDGYVYIADAGNQRVVQLSKTGDFIQQYRTPDDQGLADLRSIYVDEGRKELFFLAGDALYVAQLDG